MKFNIKSLLILGLAATLGLSSCEKDDPISLRNGVPEIPVTVSNLYGQFTAPTVSASVANDEIKIVLSIPASSGRTIKEITRVASGTAYGSVQATTGLYNTAPIPGNGTSATFVTSLTEYKTKTGKTVPAPDLNTSFLANNFYFMITLDNGQTIVPTYVRVYVTK